MVRPIRLLTILAIVLLIPVGAAVAGPIPSIGGGVLTGSNAELVKSDRDSVILIGPWGSGAQVNGQFDGPDGWSPAWNGWTHHDLTAQPASHWNIATYMADNLAGHGPGNLAAWCGESSWPSCGEGDPEGGYGNNYDEVLAWTGTVADPSTPCTVNFEAWLNLDLEPGYDYLALRYERPEDVPVTVFSLDGARLNDLVQESFVIQPEEYLQGDGARDVVRLQLRVTSDGAYSDQDCLFPSAGACQIDDISVTLDNGGLTSFADFEDGTAGDWEIVAPVGVGDFTHLMTNLEDLDPCQSNYTSQVCFIDDGWVIPETGGQFCLSWCYGPGGYIVNTRGGLAGPEKHLHNQVRSPAVAWPAENAEGAILSFGVYNHEDLSVDAPGMFWTWHVRTTTSDDPADLELVPWLDRNFVYYGSPEYRRPTHDISDLLAPGTTYFQVAFGVMELGYVWDWVGDDGYPAPYFDNVRVVAFPFSGPSLTARSIDLAQDGFPDAGQLDPDDLSAASVRFDMARSIALAQDLHLDPGDSIVVGISPRRVGAELLGPPRLHYRLEANPAFDPYRTSGLPDAGHVDGEVAFFNGTPHFGTYAFDLPDTGFFFPGDELHYYIAATSTVGGIDLTNTLPADTTGFADFSGPLAYAPQFSVRALPSVLYTGYGDQLFQEPTTLLWLDGGDLEIWYDALESIPLRYGRDYDIFATRGPSSAVGNGLGSRATTDLMAGYRTLLYTSGTQGNMTICNGDFQTDGSDDVGLLDAWMGLGDRSMFLTGDNLATDLAQSGTATQGFLQGWMQVDYQVADIRPLIGNQTAPMVLPLSEELFPTLDSWIAYGGCLSINTFDGYEANFPPAVRVAEFATPWGSGGGYNFAAAVLHDLPEDRTVIPPHNSAVISLPYDLEFVYTDPNSPPPYPVSAGHALLFDVMYFFGEVIIYDAVDDGLPRRLEARNYPNPFNPATQIDFSLPRDGRLTVKIFNVRGQLVTTLVDEPRPAGPGSVTWDGTDSRGAQVSSGVYFYEVRAAGEVKVQKMALLK